MRLGHWLDKGLAEDQDIGHLGKKVGFKGDREGKPES